MLMGRWMLIGSFKVGVTGCRFSGLWSDQQAAKVPSPIRYDTDTLDSFVHGGHLYDYF